MGVVHARRGIYLNYIVCTQLEIEESPCADVENEKENERI